MDSFFEIFVLMFFLLNPFFMSIYLLEVINNLNQKQFQEVLSRAAIISILVFQLFAVAGDRIFKDVFHVNFSSFLIFGGLIFLIMGVKFVFQGTESLKLTRGEAAHLEGSIAMPFLIGPGTLMASVLAGTKLDGLMAALCIALSVVAAILCLIILKFVFDKIKAKNEELIRRYVAIMGRVMALVTGTFAVEMILNGLSQWISNLPK